VALSRSEARRVSFWLVKWARSVEAMGLVREEGEDLMEECVGVTLGPD
jgi:hypothetical protein